MIRFQSGRRKQKFPGILLLSKLSSLIYLFSIIVNIKKCLAGKKSDEDVSPIVFFGGNEQTEEALDEMYKHMTTLPNY